MTTPPSRPGSVELPSVSRSPNSDQTRPVARRFAGGSRRSGPSQPRIGVGAVVKKVWKRCNRLFNWLVILPTAIAIVYFGIIASDGYVSEATIIIRQPEKKSMSGLGMLLQSAGITSSRDEMYTVKEFILSRDALKILDDNLHLRKLYASPTIDFLHRYNAFGDDSFEGFYRYYNKIITVTTDTSSSITKLSVNAFTPELAHSINEALLFLSEGLINEINNRAKQDLIRYASEEVEAAETAAKGSALALADYRNRQIVFDPTQQSTLQLHQISKLQSEQAEVRGQLAQLRTFAAASPYIKSLEQKSSDLQKEINTEMGKVAGGRGSMTQKLIEYQRLELDRQFADKRLTSSLASLEEARSQAQRQQLYLEKISLPNLPDEPTFPKRGKNILIVLVCSLTVFGIVKMLIIGVEEHRD